jgi:hypothetical protein
MDASGDQREAVTGKRVPGKYFVIGLVIFTIIFFGVALAISISLTPAAERFHNPTPTAQS